MGCKADFAGNSTAIGTKFNAADRPSPVYHGPRGVMQRVPYLVANALGLHHGAAHPFHCAISPQGPLQLRRDPHRIRKSLAIY